MIETPKDFILRLAEDEETGKLSLVFFEDVVMDNGDVIENPTHLFKCTKEFLEEIVQLAIGGREVKMVGRTFQLAGNVKMIDINVNLSQESDK